MPEKKDFLFGTLALRKGYLSSSQLNECLEIQEKMRKFGLPEKKIGEIALEKGYITQSQLSEILAIQRAAFKEEEKPAPPKAEAPVREEPVRVAPQRRSKLAAYQQSIIVGKVITAVVIVVALIVVLVLVSKLSSTDGNDYAGDTTGLPPSNITPPATPLNPTPAPVVTPAPSGGEEETVAEEDGYEEWLELQEFIKKNRDKTEEIIERLYDYAEKYAGTEEARDALRWAEAFESVRRRSGAEETSSKLEEQALNFFLQITENVIELKKQDRLAQALEMYRSFPERFKGTAYWKKVQEEAKRLKRIISERYSEDINRINSFLLQSRYDDALKVLDEIRRYAPTEYVKAVSKRLRDYIAERRDKRPKPTATGESFPELERKLSTARTFRQHRVYAESLKLYKELCKNEKFIETHPEVSAELDELELLLSFYRGAEEAFKKRKGRRMTVILERVGRVYGKILDVKDMLITLSSPTRGVFDLPLTQVSCDQIKQFAFRELDEGSPDTWVGLALLFIERGRKEDAEKALFEALRKPGAKQERIRAMLARMEGREPTPGSDGVVSAKDAAEKLFNQAESKMKAKKYPDALETYRRLLSRYGNSKFVKENRSRIEARISECQRHLAVETPHFAGKVLKRSDIGAGVIEVFYDFSDPSQLADWKEYNWYSIFDMHDSIWRIENGELRGSGSHGFLWKGVIDGDVVLEFDAYSVDSRRPNIQATICDDGKNGYNYLFGVGLVELGPPIDVIRFNQHAAVGIDIVKRPSKAKVNQKYHIKIEKKGKTLSLYIDGKRVLKTNNDRYRSGHISLFAIGSTVKFDNVRIVGRVSLRTKKDK